MTMALGHSRASTIMLGNTAAYAEDVALFTNNVDTTPDDQNSLGVPGL